MNAEETRPFDSIESAHEFVILLDESTEDAIRNVKEYVQRASADHNVRLIQALTLALHKMGQLSSHMQKSRRILNDLRTIRELLSRERDPSSDSSDAT